jgi:hypothetical protein
MDTYTRPGYSIRAEGQQYNAGPKDMIEVDLLKI